MDSRPKTVIDGVETDNLGETQIVLIQGKTFTLPSKDQGLWGEDMESITISVFTDGTKKDSFKPFTKRKRS